MKKIISALLTFFVFFMYNGVALAATVAQGQAQKAIHYAPNAKTIELAFVFDGPSDKNAEVLQLFQKTITRSLAPDFKASFPKDLVFTGNWTESGARAVSDKALNSRARMVISLGFMSTEYYNSKKNKNKFVMTIDQYGIRDFGNKTFNPIAQNVADLTTFKKLVPTMHKTAILMNENYYKMNKNWNALIASRLKEKQCDLNFVVIPVNSNVKASLSKIPNDVDSVFVTPLFNINKDQRKEVYQYINSKKLPSFSAVGQEDVEIGAMIGTSAANVDQKLAESTSFNIYGVLKGNAVKNEKIPFFDDKVIFFNSDTAEAVGYVAPLRLLNNCVIITHKELPKYDLGKLLDTLDENNLDMVRKRFLVSAARRSVASAYLRYLPTVRLDLGYQTYNSSFANSYSDVPTRAGAFTIGMDQVLYSPDLVTNIIVKHKKLKFDKAEAVLTKANMEYQTGNLYIETLMLENMIKVQQEYVQESRENLAIARVRQKTGKCGYEEVMRWAGEVSESEKKLLSMEAEFKNAKVHINKLLFKDQKQDFAFAPLTANDPAFFTSDLNIIDHVRNPQRLGLFTDNLVKQVIYLSPETTKLKAAIAMKKAEMSNYAQKFFMPNAKMSLEYTTQFDRHLPYENGGHNQLKAVNAATSSAAAQAGVVENYAKHGMPVDAATVATEGAKAFANGVPSLGTTGWYNSPYLGLDKNSFRFFIGAQWKPIEGGHKIAEIARCKSELNELKAYLEEVNTEIEMQVRSVVNRAIAKYFMIEKSYKAMFAEAENYQMVKDRYLVGKASVTQLADAQNLYHKAKIDALNSQYEFFKELIWVQRGLISVNWTHANPEVKGWIKKIPVLLPAEPDFQL